MAVARKVKTHVGDSASNRRPETYVPPPRTISRAYGRAVAGFTLVAVAAAALVLLFTTSRATVTVTSGGERQHVAFDAAVMPSEGAEASGDLATVRGRLLEMATTTTVTVDVPVASGSVDVTAKAVGRVTLRNRSGSAQPLVATTRLLTPEGALFRLNRAATVPARGEVVAEVTADQPGPSGAIGPATFSIPGLNDSRRQEVDAISTEPFTLPLAGGDTLTAERLAAAERAALEATISALWPQLQTQLLPGETIDRSVATATALTLVTEAVLGSRVSAVTFTGQVRVSALLFDRGALEQTVINFLFGSNAAATVRSEPDSLTLSVSRSSTVSGAIGTVTGELIVVASPASITPESLIGRTKAEAEAYLKSLPGVVEVTVKVRPWWLRRLPGEASRIVVRVLPLP